MSGPVFDATKIVEILDRHRVDYVLVGGFAAVLYGARRPTEDIDIAPSTTVDNLERLAQALRDLDARIRTEGMPGGLAFDTSAQALRGMTMLNLRTRYGDCDLTFSPAGFDRGYDGLVAAAHERHIGTVAVKVAALQDIIHSKATPTGPKTRKPYPSWNTSHADCATASTEHPVWICSGQPGRHRTSPIPAVRPAA